MCGGCYDAEAEEFGEVRALHLALPPSKLQVNRELQKSNLNS